MAKAKKITEEEAKEKAEEKISKKGEAVAQDSVADIDDNKDSKKIKIGEIKSDVKDNDSEEAKSKKSKLEALKARAKKLAEESEEKKFDIKKEMKGEEAEKKDTLVPIEDYLKASIHLGTRVITPDMRKYVYRRRADGLAVFNTAMLDGEILRGAEFLAKFAPEKAIIVCKREAGWKAANKFSEITGIRTFTKKYPAGVLTNAKLENFFEVDIVFICDPWLDKNALNDARRVRIPVMSICDTNNYTQGVTAIVPGNNKSAKSLGMILYLLTKLYVEKRKIKAPEFTIKDFVDDWDNLVPPK
ncbi:30S ribosomal protein S2 [Candidatus Pacearchaeota archaeon]|nr:30S ribosomal protein S2 [Candidatus Pacearchaeota archaeon]